MSNKRLTGYPSIDKPWLKYYADDAHETVAQYPKNISLWELIENKLIEQGNEIPAIEYFGRKVSREDFRKNVYVWAKAFKSIGVKEDEIIVIYSTWFPEIAYILLALNMIGAVSYFLKLSMSEKALREETASSRIAIVYDGMWDNVKNEFRKQKFEKVIFISANDSMPFLLKQIVSIKNFNKRVKENCDGKYYYSCVFIKRFQSYEGDLKAPFKQNRTAFITSSSGTSGGMVKGIMTSNESAIIQQLHPMAAGMNFSKGTKCLVNLPPTAATALNCLFLNSLYYNVTAVIEPRLSEQEFYNQVMKYKPAIAMMTGAFWETFFRTADRDIKRGRTLDLSFLEMPIIGGDGATVEDINWFNSILKKCGCKVPMMPGYGLSESFATIAFSYILGESDMNKKDVSPVGTPYPAVTVGVFDENGKELKYDQRGELWIKTPTMMKGYFDKEELSGKTIVNGWIHSGDLFEIDENGILYYYGRKDDSVTLDSGETVYLFDISNELLKDNAVKYAMVNVMDKQEGIVLLAAHIVIRSSCKDKLSEILCRLDQHIQSYLPKGVTVKGYAVHDLTFKASPTTAKKDRQGYKKIRDGYCTYSNGQIVPVSF